MKSPVVHVTDHAVLRYLERAHGLDVAAVRRHIAGRAVTAAALGASGVAIEGVKLVLRETTVVTVVRTQWPSRRAADWTTDAAPDCAEGEAE